MAVTDVSRRSVGPDMSSTTNQRCVTSQRTEHLKFLKFKLTYALSLLEWLPFSRFGIGDVSRCVGPAEGFTCRDD